MKQTNPTPSLLRFKKVHYYLIPLIALVVWWGMLIAMISAWSIQGHPIYAFMGKVKQDPVYISDVGATNLQPLFISCSGFQAIFFVGTLVMEFFLRRHYKLQPYVSNKQPKFAITSIVCAVIGQLGILFVAIFNTVSFTEVHFSMVGVFIAFSFFACLFNFFNSFIFGNFPDRLHPNHERVIFGKHRWANLYMVSFFLKCFWLICAAIFALCFGCYMKIGNDSISAIFEWLISFWYGLLLVFWSIDLFPSAVKHYQLSHPQYYDTLAEHDNHLDTVVVSSRSRSRSRTPPSPRHLVSTSDDNTYVGSGKKEESHLHPQEHPQAEHPQDAQGPLSSTHIQHPADNEKFASNV